MALWQFEETVECAPWVDGMESMLSIPISILARPSHLPLPSVRLYGTKNFKPLGTLSYHKQGCYALTFSNQLAEEDLNNNDDDLSAEERAGRRLWLASGGKDSRVCIWPLLSFSR
jgi:hypothetical protein